MRRVLSIFLFLMLCCSILSIQLQASTPPDRQARNVQFSNVGYTGFKATWLNGSGTGRIVVVQTNETYTLPSNGTYYNAPDTGNYISPNNDALGVGKVIYSGSGSTRTVTVTNLTPGVKYYVRVYELNYLSPPTSPDPAYNTNTAVQNPSSISTSIISPPTNLNATGVTVSSAILNWIAATDATSYRLDVSTGTGVNFDAGILVNFNNLNVGNVITYTVTGLTMGNTYYFRLRSVATNPPMTSANSLEGAFTTTFDNTPATYRIQYYTDAGLSSPMTNPPALSVLSGTTSYYIKITASEPLQAPPTIRIDDNGSGTLTPNTNDVVDSVLTTSVGGSTTVFTYTRTINSLYPNFGEAQEVYIIKGTDLAGNTNAYNATYHVYGVNTQQAATHSAYVITRVPTVVNVTSTIANGLYGIGSVIPVTVQFTYPVKVTGTPKIKLNAAATSYATYVSGSASTTLTFEYTVVANDVAADLDYSATTSLGLNGGTLNDNFGNPADLTLPTPGAVGSLGFNKNIQIDGLPPTILTLNPADGATGVAIESNFVITFDENVQKGSGFITIYKMSDN